MTLPKENLDNKAFSDLLKEAISRIPVYAPEWTDHNIHDPGITFIELFAWLTEMQIYRLNRINDKSYRKFLKLMGIPELKSANAAKVDVTFSLLQGVTKLKVPVGTIVAATDPVTGEDILFTTERDLTLINTELRVLSHQAEAGNIYIDNSEANEKDNVYYFAFGSDKPKEGDELYIGFKDDPGTEIDFAFYLLDDVSFKKENSTAVPLGTLIWEYYDANLSPGTNGWKRIEEDRIKDETKHLTLSGKVNVKINIDAPMKKTDVGEAKGLFWLKCRVADEISYQIPPKIDCILLNTVSATHAVKHDRKENTFCSTGLPDFCIDLKFTPVLDKTLLDKKNETISKIDLIVKSPTVNSDELWEEVEDFDASRPGDKHYTVDLASGRVTFGNGINGRIPPKGKDNITVCYFSGGGTRGNVKPGAIKKILSKNLFDKVIVNNEKEASGGMEAETLEEAIQRVKKEMKEVTRAVKSEDYEYLALITPGVQIARAKALPRYHPSQPRYHPSQYREVPGIISVIVVPKNYSNNPNPIPSQDFLKAVYWHLEEYRLLATELFVLPPMYVEISVGATLGIKPKSLPDAVIKDVKKKLNDFLHPIPPGGFDGKGWPFGRPVYVSEIYEKIDSVDGVDYVKDVTLSGKYKTEKGDIEMEKSATGDIFIPAEGLVYLGNADCIVNEGVKCLQNLNSEL